ncbi:MAG TPA: hypothetical protein PK328_13705, partial [Chitinophagaceae bacterium]|nr:hypothetical protein [Chitinophagaceae bacterium]
MDRRAFLKARRLNRAATDDIQQPFRTQSGISAYTGAWTEQEVIHLLKRTMFGAKPSDINYF